MLAKVFNKASKGKKKLLSDTKQLNESNYASSSWKEHPFMDAKSN